MRAAVLIKAASVALVAVVGAAGPAWAKAPTGGGGSGGGSGGGGGAGPTPVYAGDFPDPAVVTLPGGGYYAYATQTGSLHVQAMASAGGYTSWASPAHEALAALPAWDTDTGLAANTWAPSVAQFGSTWVMWYTARYSAMNKQCISVATASSPAGPFSDQSGSAPVVCDTNGSIDPNVFVDVNGTPYLLWKSDDNSVGQPTHIWSAPLSAAGTSLSGAPPVNILTEDAPWQSPSVEGPTMTVSNGTYYLFYGANNWQSSSAGIGYATCASPTSPCTDRSTTGPWLASTGQALGPAGPAVFTDSNGVHLAFHAWDGCVGYPTCNRAFYVGGLTFRGGVPKISF